MKARPYQLHAVERVFQEWQKTRSTLVVMPTGTGKTVTFAAIIRRALKDEGWLGQWMVVAHRAELVGQAAHKLEACDIGTQIEMADKKAELALLRRPDCVVGSIQTLTRRGTRFDPTQFRGIIIDEAHHYTSPSWRAFIQHMMDKNPELVVLGVTATPDRADEVGLKAVFNSVAFDYGLNQAIDDGWLAPLRPLRIEIAGMDFSGVSTQAGDLNARELAETMDAEKVLHPIVKHTIEYAGNRKTIVFAPPGFKTDAGGETFRVSEKICELFNRYEPRSARLISDRTPPDERREILKDYAAGRLTRLVNVGVLTEGFDDPGIQVVVIARPTKSRALFAQMVGRGTRPLPGIVDRFDTAVERRNAIAASEKPRVDILDFVGISGKHKLVSLVEILAGKEAPDVIDLANRIITKSKKPMDVETAVREAKQTLEAKRLQAEAKAKKREKVKVRSVTVTVTEVDPFDVLDLSPTRRIPTLSYAPASPKQIAMMQRLRIPVAKNMSRVDASRLIGTCLDRRRQGLASFNQVSLLKSHGIAAGDMSYEQATEAINMLREIPVISTAKASSHDWSLPEVVA